ncbi:MAG: serine hydrolase [Lachnospiraceae bacterium]|nr:serine hydrolase [Lachnospiraceae bacterium]
MLTVGSYEKMKHKNRRDGAVDFPGVRTQTVQGQVHDETAWYSMGGISGHAGLFANACDLAKLAGVMLTGGYGENRFFSRNVMDLFTAPKSVEFGQWGLGWWRNGDGQRPWYFGTEAGSDVIGHQGWTGTLVMIDPANDLVIVYLTNKINSPVTDNEVNVNRFDGNWYTASTVGFVPQILTIGMDEDTDITPQLRSLAADMAGGSRKLIPENAAPDHPAVKNAESKAAVLKKWTK